MFDFKACKISVGVLPYCTYTAVLYGRLTGGQHVTVQLEYFVAYVHSIRVACS